MGHFTGKLLHEDSDESLYLVTGKKDNAPIWCYALVPARMEAAFKTALTESRIRINQYGRVLFSGHGAQPPAQVQELIAAHYPA